MLEQILDIERDAFLWLNGGHTPFLDRFWWFISSKQGIIIAAIAFFTALYIRNKQLGRKGVSIRKRVIEGLLFVLAVAIVITLCDQFASHLCKPLFMRYRPTHHPDFENVVQIVNGYRGGRYGFISSHAANAFGFAMVTSLFIKQKWYSWTVFIWATLTAYSRIYLGVHFISDIIPGILVGIFFGWAVYKIRGVKGMRGQGMRG
ncbi:MAG: phosphatase PAP2 family protein [Tannerella sp.]|jgi:undecaprenyl-diphosphatase|nr:phosphatase PAP2 family protein [Tannerella sp.]